MCLGTRAWRHEGQELAGEVAPQPGEPGDLLGVGMNAGRGTTRNGSLAGLVRDIGDEVVVLGVEAADLGALPARDLYPDSGLPGTGAITHAGRPPPAHCHGNDAKPD